MAKYAMQGERVVAGLLGLGWLAAVALTGCSAADPAIEPSDETSQDPLLVSGFCGGRSDVQCSSGSVCSTILNSGCPGDGVVGLCVARPRFCAPLADPVCGCDGVTYGSLCKAAQAGAAVVHLGACADPPRCDVKGAACPGAGTCVPEDQRGTPWWFPLPSEHPGTCECKATQTCGAGQRFNDNPLVCACEALPDPCAGVACPRGQECDASSGSPVCVPDACTGVACRNGQLCVVTPDRQPSCIPDPCAGIACQNGQLCTVGSDGGPACIPNTCAGIACRNGQTCVVQPDGSPACR